MLGPLSFVIAALIVYWSTWTTVSWLLGLQVVIYVGYVVSQLFDPQRRARVVRQVRSSAWLIAFFLLVMGVSWLGTFGGIGVIAHPWDTACVAVIAFLIYHWGARSGLSSAELTLEEDDGE